MRFSMIPIAFGLIALSSLAAAAQTSPAATDCNDAGIVTKQLSCFIDAAEDAGDPALCEAAGELAVRFNCLALYAERSADVAPCARIAGGNETAALRGACVAGVALATRAPELCRGIGHATLRDTCLMTLVVQHEGDRALCAEIANAALRETCVEPLPQ